ncbi:MAG: Mut7-C RNAse domain-containing protein [Nanoarchaeota archaeon]
MVKLEMKENTIYCAKCNQEMREVLLPKYEFEEGLPLHNIHAYRCNNCGKIFFTEKQAKEMEARTSELREYRFGFERKLTISGRSLSLGIPSELATQLNLKKGQKVKIYPISKEGILIKKV